MLAASSPASVLVVLGVVLLLVGIWLGGHPELAAGLRPQRVRPQDAATSWSTRSSGMIQHDYYRKIPRSQLVDKGLAGAVASLDDRFSHYYDPEDYRSFQTGNPGHLAGIGIDIQRESAAGCSCSDVFQDSPAGEAGLGAR